MTITIGSFTPVADHPLTEPFAGAPVPAFTPPPLGAHPSSLSGKGIVAANDRDGGHKYFEAMGALESVLDKNSDWEASLQKRITETSSAWIQEKHFLICLLEAGQTIRNQQLPIRDRNEKTIACLRKALEMPFYQKAKASDNKHCLLLQQLCTAKITQVYPYETLKELVCDAATSADSQALKGLETIDKTTVGPLVRSINHILKKAKARYKKSFFALLFQKIRGEFGGKFGIRSDPGGSSNVPYVRSQFMRSAKSGDKKQVTFCRFGTPTIQDSSGTKIDPIFLGVLDDMKKRGENFLYVNHQKLEGREGVRAGEIQALEKTYDNYHFLSIPLDGAIVDSIRENRSIYELKTLIHDSFLERKNGCALPVGANISSEDLQALLDHVHECWFPGQTIWTPETLEAFWGIFNTILKHKVIQNLDIDMMNSSCKDNKDRGGTFGTIDEAVRNVLLGDHENPEKLRELVFSALAPYMIKLERILDNREDPNHHRLGFLVSVLNHIAKLDSPQIRNIQRKHHALCFPVLQQEVPKNSLAKVPAASPPSTGFSLTHIFHKMFR